MMTDECVGCGYCCRKIICFPGIKANRDHVSAQGNNRGPCPSLVSKEGRYWCGLVLGSSGKELERIKFDLSIGAGCSSAMNSDRQRCK